MKKVALSSVGVVALGTTTLIGAGGVFAADGTLTQTDTVVVTVDTNCSLASSGSGLQPASTYTRNLANGAFDTNITGSTFTVTCNDTGGWKLTAVGYTNNVQGTTYMDASTNVGSDDIPTGTTLDGSVSNWAAKFAKGGTDAQYTTITYANGTFDLIPSTVTTIATGSSTAGNATVTATYGVGISATQSAGTYTGKVLYTLGHPIGETNNNNQNNNQQEPANPVEDPEEEPVETPGGNETPSGGNETPSGGNSTPSDTNSGSGKQLQSLSPTSLTNHNTNSTSSTTYNTTNNNSYNTTNTTSGGGGSYPASGNNDDTFATVDEIDTGEGDKDKEEENELEDEYEAPLGVTTSSNDDSSNGSGMETGFLVALGAAAVAGVATYALIRSQDKEEN